MALGKKTGGRTKGSLNAPKAALFAMMTERWPDYHPVMAMAEIANDPAVDLDTRFAAHKEVAQYVEPKRKAVEVTGEDGGPIETVFRWASEK
jgi:hypothetical protein